MIQCGYCEVETKAGKLYIMNCLGGFIYFCSEYCLTKYVDERLEEAQCQEDEQR